MRRDVRIRSSAALAFALSLALSLSVSTSASAQLGRLKKIAGDAVKDAAKEAAGAKKPETPAGSREARVDYSITESRLTAILSALQPYLASAKSELEAKAMKNAAAAETDASNAKAKAVADCITKASNSGALPDMEYMTSPKGEAITKRMSAVNQRMQIAQSTGKYRALVFAQDTALVLQMQYMANMFAAAKSCGTVPYTPAVVLNNRAAELEQSVKLSKGGAATGLSASSTRGDDAFDVPADKRGGMTQGQFGRIREAIAIWQLQQTGDLPANSYKFTEAEVAVLSAQAAALKAFGPVWKANILQWASWNDIKSW